MFRIHSSLATTVVGLDTVELDPGIAAMRKAPAVAVRVSMGTRTVAMTPAEARALAFHLTLTAEAAEAPGAPERC